MRVPTTTKTGPDDSRRRTHRRRPAQPRHSHRDWTSYGVPVNPINYNDPTGHRPICDDCTTADQKALSAELGQEAEATTEELYKEQQAQQAFTQLITTAQGFSQNYGSWSGEFSRTTGLWQPPSNAQALQIYEEGLAAQSACLSAGGLAECEARHDPLTEYELNQANVDIGALLRGFVPGVGCYRAAGNASAGNVLSCIAGVVPVAGAAVDVVGAGLDAGAASEQLSGLALARKLGVEGEAAIPGAGNTTRIALLGGGYRIPDILDESAGVLGEVKNVQSLSYTAQLQDYAAYAKANGLQFDLYVRGGTQLSGPLQAAISAGQINLFRWLPG